MSKNRLWTLLPLTTLPTFCVTSCWNINKEIDSIKGRVDESSYYVSKYEKNNLVEGKNIVFNKLAKPELSHEDDKYYAERKKEVDDYLKNNFFDVTINNRNFVDPKTYGANDINYYDLWKKELNMLINWKNTTSYFSLINLKTAKELIIFWIQFQHIFSPLFYLRDYQMNTSLKIILTKISKKLLMSTKRMQRIQIM